MSLDLHLPSPIQEIQDELFTAKDIRVFIKRDDLIHPFVSGNKWRKLKYILLDAQSENKNHLVTFGGAWSNHLLATAWAGKAFGFKVSAFVRGEEVLPLNPILQSCQEQGMQFIFVDRTAYRNKKNLFHCFFKDDTNAYFIDEGGASPLAMQGIAEMVDEILSEQEHTFDSIFLACGTGTTLCGIALAIKNKKNVTFIEGISVLKGIDFKNNVTTYPISLLSNWKVHQEFHLNGYAKVNPIFLSWLKDFQIKHNILLDPVYTGKMMYAVFQLAEQNYFKPGSKILTIHTGGIFGQESN